MLAAPTVLLFPVFSRGFFTQAFCCSRFHLGCGKTLTTVPFDCTAGGESFETKTHNVWWWFSWWVVIFMVSWWWWRFWWWCVLATPKRWRFVRGHNKPRDGVAPSTFWDKNAYSSQWIDIFSWESQRIYVKDLKKTSNKHIPPKPGAPKTSSFSRFPRRRLVMLQAWRNGRWDGQWQRNNGVARSGWLPKGKRGKNRFPTMKKGAPCGCLGDLLGMKSYPVIWGLQ